MHFSGTSSSTSGQYRPLMPNKPLAVSIFTVSLIIATVMAACSLFQRRTYDDVLSSEAPTANGDSESNSSTATISLSFIGNSIIYFNDCPRLMQALNPRISQDSCLRGGASLVSLLRDGNGMKNKFNTPNALEPDGKTADIGAPDVTALLTETEWNFVIMNDYTQGPAREESRESAVIALRDGYAPLLERKRTIPVFLMTWAYRKPAKNSDDLFPIENFTESLLRGYQAYASALDESLGESRCRVAPVGLAFLKVHGENVALWEKLFHVDDFHPSPRGSFLEACVLHCTVFGDVPEESRWGSDEDVKNLWSEARRMQPPGDPVQELPSVEDCRYLADVAMRVCTEEGFAK